jgi:copper chaperone NosL
MKFVKNYFFLLIVIILISSCSQKTEEIKFNSDECDYCNMQIGDNRFAAEMISDEAKIHKFDSIECLTGFAITKNFVDDNSQSFYVMDFLKLGNFINARKAFYLNNNNFHSPMGLNVQAFATETERDMFSKKNGGDKISWEDVVKMVKESEN